MVWPVTKIVQSRQEVIIIYFTLCHGQNVWNWFFFFNIFYNVSWLGKIVSPLYHVIAFNLLCSAISSWLVVLHLLRSIFSLVFFLYSISLTITCYLKFQLKFHLQWSITKWRITQSKDYFLLVASVITFFYIALQGSLIFWTITLLCNGFFPDFRNLKMWVYFTYNLSNILCDLLFIKLLILMMILRRFFNDDQM